MSSTFVVVNVVTEGDIASTCPTTVEIIRGTFEKAVEFATDCAIEQCEESNSGCGDEYDRKVEEIQESLTYHGRYTDGVNFRVDILEV